MTAPTGAGKTLAGLRFALRHCRVYGRHRIIAVLPFLAIIDQNAGVYRQVLGDDQIIEHHSSVEVTERSTDNWGAPMIVTTAVQFLETLFSCRPGRVRKLHSIARSVILLDEVQSMPHQLLEPTLSLLRLLVRDYGCTVVLSSATVSRFGKCRSLPSGFLEGEVREIIPDVAQLFRSLKRVRYELPFMRGEKWSWDRLAEEVQKHPRALVILNTRKQAQQVFRMLRRLGVDALHLSTTMHSVHRKHTIEEANRKLKSGERVVLVSTQCIEAGVDIDFPVVFRRWHHWTRSSSLPGDVTGRASSQRAWSSSSIPKTNQRLSASTTSRLARHAGCSRDWTTPSAWPSITCFSRTIISG